MGGKDRLDLGKQIGALRQDMTAVAVDQPVTGNGYRARDFLQAENIGVDLGEVGNERRMQLSAPCIQRDNPHHIPPIYAERFLADSGKRAMSLFPHHSEHQV